MFRKPKAALEGRAKFVTLPMSPVTPRPTKCGWRSDCEAVDRTERNWYRDQCSKSALKHYIRFADAVIALEDEHALTIQDVYSDEEERWVTLEMDAFGRLLVVIYAWRADNIRLISARLATAHERRQYAKSGKT